MADQFFHRLEKLGFFKYSTANEVEFFIQSFSKSGWLAAIYGNTRRLFPGDEEELSEGGVVKFIRTMEPFLAKQGVFITQLADHFVEEDPGYSISVNGKKILVYGPAEMDSANIWALAKARTFALVNELLLQAKSKERLFAMHGGNELFGFFLTPELKKEICKQENILPRDRAYVPTEEPPWFGQEHD